jgi:hypothetical protein
MLPSALNPTVHAGANHHNLIVFLNNRGDATAFDAHGNRMWQVLILV